MEELASRGVAGFKAFMSTVGTLDFQTADDLTLFEGMKEAARLGLPVLVHAENRTITDGLASRAISTLRLDVRDYLDSRPVVAELEAIGRAIILAEEAGCSLHVVHVSTGKGVALVAAARARGVDVTCETCAHYLVLTDEDAEELGAAAKCAPPLRPRQDLEELWERIFEHDVEFVTSDHSPCLPEMKVGDDFFRVWGGISGCQSLLNVLLDEGYHERGLPLERVAALTAGERGGPFRVLPERPPRGRLRRGSRPRGSRFELHPAPEDLFYRHKMSPYVGRAFPREKSSARSCGGSRSSATTRSSPTPVGKLIRPDRQTVAMPQRGVMKT